MKKKLLIWTMCLSFALSGNVFSAAAAEADEVSAEDTAAALDELEGVITDEEAEAFNGNIGNMEEDVMMTGLTASNGRVIAASFPEDFLPVGFHKGTYNYEGQTIDVAVMDNSQVMLVYLADANGSAGDFYVLDQASLQMSEFVQIYNGSDQYLVVLDPGDSVVAPVGFTKVSLKWYGKIVNAWSLPGVTPDQLAGSIFDSFKTLKAYAAMAGEAAVVNGAGEDDEAAQMAGEFSDSETEGSLAGENADAKTAAQEGLTGGNTGSYSLESANPAEFLLLYAVNEQGSTGFYLFDKENNTYQRYVEISGTDEKVIDQYKNSARLRLIIIAVLSVLLVISLFVIFNLIISHREDDEEDDVDVLRKKVAAKNRREESDGLVRGGNDGRRRPVRGAESDRRRMSADEFEEEEIPVPRRRPAAEDEMPIRRRLAAEDEMPTRRRPAAEDEMAAPRRRMMADDEMQLRRRPAAEGEAPVRRRMAAEGEAPVRRRPVAEGEIPVRRRPVTEGEAPVRRRPVTEGEIPVRRRPVTEGEAPVRRRPAAEGDVPVRRRPAAEGEAPARRRPVAEGEPVRRPRRRMEDE